MKKTDFCPALLKKADLHMHASRSGLIRDFEKAFHCSVDHSQRKNVSSIEEMQEWVDFNIHPYVKSRQDWLKRIELMFFACEKDNVVYAEPDFTLRDIMRFSSFDEFRNEIDQIRVRHPHIRIKPVLSFSRKWRLDNSAESIAHLFAQGWFGAIDLCNNELLANIEMFKPLYELAEIYGLRKKAHVGEFGTADDVLFAIKELKLDEVQHGIALADNVNAMEEAAQYNVMFNICPASNIHLRRINSYEEHPIGKMYKSGLKVTINTDDLLIFNSTLSEQYEKLLKAKVLNEEELIDICNMGLKRVEET